MDFNTDKCVSMSFGKAVHHSTYTLSKSALKSVSEHKDVGVLSTRELQRQIYNTKSRTELWELGNKVADRLDPNSLVSFVKWWA